MNTNKNPDNHKIASQNLEQFQEYFYTNDPVGKYFVDTVISKDNDEEMMEFGKVIFEKQRHFLPIDTTPEIFAKMWINSLPPVPTKYEARANYAILNDLSSEIEIAADNLGFERRKKIIFGTIPSGRLNGFAIPINNDEYDIILIDRGAFAIANIISSQFGLLFSDINRYRSNSDTHNSDKIEFQIGSEIQSLIQDLILNYVLKGDPHLTQKIPGNNGNIKMSHSLLIGFELFLIGHEYAHCLLGHLDRGTLIRSAASRRASVDIINQSWKDEYEADYLGWRLSHEVLKKNDVPLSIRFVGAQVFFAAIAMMDAARSIIEKGTVVEEVSPSHPPAYERARRISQFTQKMLTEKGISKKDLDAIEQFNQSAISLLEASFQSLAPKLASLHQNGTKCYNSI